MLLIGQDHASGLWFGIKICQIPVLNISASCEIVWFFLGTILVELQLYKGLFYGKLGQQKMKENPPSKISNGLKIGAFFDIS